MFVNIYWLTDFLKVACGQWGQDAVGKSLL